jgi:lysophospholipase L1-like esterase
MILTDKDKMVLTPTYHVFRMYKAHQGATLIPVELNTPPYSMDQQSVPSLSVSASRDEAGKLHLSIVNLDPNKSTEVTTTFTGASIKNVSGEVLTATAMNALNSFDNPNNIKPAAFSGYKLQDSKLILNVPAKSVIMLELTDGQSRGTTMTASDQPSPRTDQNSMLAHQELLEKAKKGRIDVYFEGDSITRRWGTSDQQYKHFLENWKQNFFGWNAADFGWGADLTQHILWRLQNGELDNVNPKVIVLMAGTNNVGNKSPEGNSDPRVDGVTRGIKAILDTFRQKAPNATIILMGITPRNDNMAVMPIINEINVRISRFADGKKIRYLNINDKLADKHGKLFEGMTNKDLLHLDVKGYQVWADALKPILTELLGPPAKEDHAPPPTGDPSQRRPAPSQ